MPTLADDGLYIGSESSFYRVLNEIGQSVQRATTKLGVSNSNPKAKIPTRPNQPWTWDISYLATLTRGQHYYHSMILDIFSRKIVGAEVYAQTLSELAADARQRAVWGEKCVNGGTTLHSDSNNVSAIFIV